MQSGLRYVAGRYQMCRYGTGFVNKLTRNACYSQVLGIDNLAKALERVAGIASRMQLPVQTLVLDVQNVCGDIFKKLLAQSMPWLELSLF